MSPCGSLRFTVFTLSQLPFPFIEQSLYNISIVLAGVLHKDRENET